MALKNIIGVLPQSDSVRTKRARIHQGWWRAFVLNRPQGDHPARRSELICSCLPANDGETETANFISHEIAELALKAACEHNEAKHKSGIIEVNRLTKNLLSSQPLCFNFFGIIALDHTLGLKVIREFYPEVSEFHAVLFEHAPHPKQQYTDDNSAFDVALEVSIGGDRGLIGIECKYTESFSPEKYDKERYREIYNTSDNFIAAYEKLKSSRFNQLFRNQLIAESIVQSGDMAFVKTALFCSPDDYHAINTAEKFDSMIKPEFKVIDFMGFLTAIQKQNITEETRRTSMMLWARYMAHELSEAAANE